MAAVQAAAGDDGWVFLAAQRRARQEDPAPRDLFDVGTVGVVLQVVPLPDGTLRVLVEGRWRARIAQHAPGETFTRVLVDPVSFGGTPQSSHFKEMIEATGATVYTIHQDDNLTAALSFDARPKTRII